MGRAILTKWALYFLHSTLRVGALLLGLSVGLWWLLTQPLLPSQPLPSAITVNADRLVAVVRELSAHLPPRDTDPEHLAVSARYIFDQFQACGGKPEMQDFQVIGLTYHNVQLNFHGSGAKIVVGAHYDTLDGLPGADDNASGVAGLIELACLLVHHPVTTPVELVAYSLEEPPQFGSKDMGSYHHAVHNHQADKEIALMISLEMIGYFDDRPGTQHFPLKELGYLYPNRGNFIAIVGRLQEIWLTRRVKAAMRHANSLPIYSLNAPPIISGIAASDHSSYWLFDYPALMITDTAYNRNLAYHTANDTADRLDYVGMAQVIQGVYQVLAEWRS